jgi:hypothetical protein
MQLTRFMPVVLAFLLCCSLTATIAEDTTVSVQSTIYHQTDGGGIEEIDEDASVFETIILMKKRVGDKDIVNLRLMVDVVSAASIEREHNAEYRALQSGASGSVYGGISGTWEHEFEVWQLSGGLGFGGEYAYRSFSANGSASRIYNENNTELGLHLLAFADTLDMIRFNGASGPEDNRNTITASADITQKLSPRSSILLDGSVTVQDGFLANQFGSVFINGVEDFEILPDSRVRASFTGRYKHAAGEEDAVEIGLRYYTDDWGISAETIDLRYFHYMKGRSLLLEPVYRLYVQSEADHYQESFTAASEYQTSDPDLGDFIGNMVGTRLTFIDGELFGIGGDWSTGLYYQTRNNGIDSFWLTFGGSFE